MITRIKKRKKEGKSWYKAQRMILPFIWSDYFPTFNKGKGLEETLESTDKEIVISFIIDKKKKR